MVSISRSSKKKDLHRRPSIQKTRIINRFQRYDAFSAQTGKTLKQIDLTEKKYQSFIETLISEGILKTSSASGTAKYWLKAEKVNPKEKDNKFLITSVVFAVTFVIIMFIFFAFS
ncbi:MAG: hypothetical protein HeimC3_42970 [Candidatus Heimdallarchaeota archaeon LC_3]|nr:MAG: hypothetical protein HeimC3_42970 [Candidatus Heimdallarchaeota archaeon LC_3]